MLRFLHDEKNDLLEDAPIKTGSRKITNGLYLTMNSGAKKNSSEKGSKYVQMEKIYVDKLLKVIRNKE
jgi:hypothetical protein